MILCVHKLLKYGAFYEHTGKQYNQLKTWVWGVLYNSSHTVGPVNSTKRSELVCDVHIEMDELAVCK